MHYLVLLGALVNMYGAGVYMLDIVRGKTKPNLVSWFLWAAAPLIASAAAFSEGIRWAALPTFMVGFGPVLVIITAVSTRHALWRVERFDCVCGAFSVVALILWFITKQPYLAILFAIFSDGLASLPTLKKAWLFPETESGIAYASALFNMLTTLVALQVFTFSEMAFPIYNIFINAALVGAIYRKRPLVSS